MILKYKRTKRIDNVDYDYWHFVDGITNCSVYFDPSVECTCIDISGVPGFQTLALYDEAYLINENGKTIEKIAVARSTPPTNTH